MPTSARGRTCCPCRTASRDGASATPKVPISTKPRRARTSWNARSVNSPESSQPTFARHRGLARRSVPRSDLAYFWGEDAWSIERAAVDFRKGLEEQAGQPFDIWRTSGDEDDSSAEMAAGKRRDRVIDGISERLSIAPMFAAGTLVVVRQPGSLLREQAARERVIKLLTTLAPGNGLVFLDLLAAGGSGPAQQGAL